MVECFSDVIYEFLISSAFQVPYSSYFLFLVALSSFNKAIFETQCDIEEITTVF